MIGEIKMVIKDKNVFVGYCPHCEAGKLYESIEETGTEYVCYICGYRTYPKRVEPQKILVKEG